VSLDALTNEFPNRDENSPKNTKKTAFESAYPLQSRWYDTRMGGKKSNSPEASFANVSERLSLFREIMQVGAAKQL
jgi:hypothetical protein